MSNKKSSSSLIKINRFTPLLTDVLPYETPLSFGNNSFYRRFKETYDKNHKENYKKKAQGSKYEEISAEDFFKKHYLPPFLRPFFEGKNKEITIPYKYNIQKNLDSIREISLIHPLNQIIICDFYEKYKDLILYNTNKSSISLRFPYKNVNLVHKRLSKVKTKLLQSNYDFFNASTVDLKEEATDENDNLNQDDYLNKFFIYKKFDIIYKFYESYLMKNNEKRYRYMASFDIKRFFNSIYTHSIEWAVKNKEQGKLRGEKFESAFDEIMRNANYGETHGINIGAEISRIFAEIIMQDIDNQIIKNLEEQEIINQCKIYRFVDDFFVFYNDKTLLDKIKIIIEEKLKNYCLFLNDTKFQIFERPFVSNKTIVTIKCKKILSEFLNSYNIENKSLHFKIKRNFSSDYIIDEIRCAIKENSANLSEIVNYCLGMIKNTLFNILSYIAADKFDANEKEILKFLKKILNISFYLYSYSQKNRTTLVICKICYSMLQIAGALFKNQPSSNNNDIVPEIKNEIYKYILEFFETLENKNRTIEIEQLDILKLLSAVKTEKIPEKRLSKLFDIDNLSYFYIVSLLDYIKKDFKNFPKIFDKIKTTIFNNFKVVEPLKYAQNYLLLIDLIKCPFLDKDFKKEIINLFKPKNLTENDAIAQINTIAGFYEWNCKITIPKMLELKELHEKYN